MPALREKHDGQRSEYYTQVKERRHISDIIKIQDDHIIKIYRAPSCNLPQTCATRNYRQTSAVPILILFELIGQTWPRADQAHFAAKNVEKLRQLVKASLS